MWGYYLRLALASYRKGWGAVALALVTMAVGIAATMTAWTVFAALSGAAIPGVSDHLYVTTMDARGADASDASPYTTPDSLLTGRDAKALMRGHSDIDQAAVALSLTQAATVDGKHTTRTFGFIALGSPLATFGIPLLHGRPWTRAEAAAGDPVIVINVALADKLFGTTRVVGRSVHMGHQDFRIVGVIDKWKPRVRFVALGSAGGGALGNPVYFLIPADAALAAGVGPMSTGECPKGSAVIIFQSAKVGACRWLELWTGLRTASAVSSYARDVDNYAHAQHAAGRFVHPPHARIYRMSAWLGLNHVVPDQVKLNVMLAGGLLLLCMVNVAGLLAARFLRRRRQVATRRALGASRRSIFAQHLVESGLLGLGGAVLAWPLTWLGLWIVRQQPEGYVRAARLDLALFATLVVLSIVVGIVVGVLPAWRVCRQPPATLIKEG